jgi:hypothetical protein
MLSFKIEKYYYHIQHSVEFVLKISYLLTPFSLSSPTKLRVLYGNLQCDRHFETYHGSDLLCCDVIE